MTIKNKLDETKFYIELFHVLETRSDTLTSKFNIEQEASFVLSAILNGFFSTAEMAMENGKKRDKVEVFKKAHPLFYAHSTNGGLRNTTVHVKHIKPDHSGYIPPKGDSINFNLKETPKIVKEKQDLQSGINFNMGPYFYLEVNGKFKRIMELVDEHYPILEQFVSTI